MRIRTDGPALRYLENPKRFCQTNANKPLFAVKDRNLPGTKLAPLSESSCAVELDMVAFRETAFPLLGMQTCPAGQRHHQGSIANSNMHASGQLVFFGSQPQTSVQICSTRTVPFHG